MNPEIKGRCYDDGEILFWTSQGLTSRAARRKVQREKRRRLNKALRRYCE